MATVVDEGLSYDDVLLVPQRSSVFSRRDVDTTTRLTKVITLAAPLISANMDSVTEASMAIAMARCGGLGVIHRFLTIEREVEEVRKVKRSESIIIERPFTLTGDATLKDARRVTHDHGISGILIVDKDNRLRGILTSRDMKFETIDSVRVSDLMTHDVITAPIGIPIEDAKEMMRTHKIEKLPLVDTEGRLSGLITAKDIIRKETTPKASKDKKGRLLVGASVGATGDYIERTQALLDAGADAVFIDIAHGHSEHTIQALKTIKRTFGDVQVIAGNVATAEGTRDLIAAGADAIKVGVGPGSTCTIRIVTGAGMPQLTAVMACAEAAGDVPVVADGGMKNSGDITKALAAGAAVAFSGFLFSGTDEAPGVTLIKDGRKYKIYRGSAGYGTALSRKQLTNNNDVDVHDVVPEGVESLVPYKGTVAEIVYQLLGGLRSGMSYCGSHTLAELRANARFVKITPASMRESGSHDVELLK